MGCNACQSMLRPDVVLFGEELPLATVELLYAELDVGFDAIFTIGTTSVFPYIAGPVHLRCCGWPTVEVNPGRSKVSDYVDVRLSTGAASALDAIWRRYHERRLGAWRSSRWAESRDRENRVWRCRTMKVF